MHQFMGPLMGIWNEKSFFLKRSSKERSVMFDPKYISPY